MTKLTDTQAVILSAAAQRDSHNVLPLGLIEAQYSNLEE